MGESKHRDGGPGPAARLMVPAGLAYLGLGIVLGAAWAAGVRASLLPTGWILPAILVITGMLMIARRRADLVLVLWGGLVAVVFVLDVLVYASSLGLGTDDPAVFDATVIVAALALVPLILRPGFTR